MIIKFDKLKQILVNVKISEYDWNQESKSYARRDLGLVKCCQIGVKFIKPKIYWNLKCNNTNCKQTCADCIL